MSDPATPSRPIPHAPSYPGAPSLPPTAGPYTPPYAAPEHVSGPPQGFAPPPGYAAPLQGYGPYAPPAPRRLAGRRWLGTVAFWLAMTAALGATALGAVAAYNIGLGTGRDLALSPGDIDFDWSILTPVREWVLIGELAFWAGTVLGIWALVQGIVATVKNRGRGWAIAAIVIAAIGPVAFSIGVQGLLAAGFATGASLS
ncbi:MULTISPECIES: DUF3824 domain-containing protein [unclassified Microbacterium]|uniref:DUF3824 domain-containing protein n=1 Tax=Microbacterium sp. zg-B185 TaxID=3049070 RepID=UPI00214B6527|nr:MULTISPECIES: DUF3824 domain-containing protein [unclassified Microbacterium]MCR2809671.1 DUF3824 domain-containing protein [Microbacterium sp. zg.B185]WIM18007.1 DUF3824 domain-containing protein [Microbacterium sp. zg-B185]